jgi:hypothetical protein
MRRTGVVVIALFAGCGGGGGATGGGGGTASGGSSGAGGAGGEGLSGLSDAAVADANGGTLAAPDANPISPDGPASVVHDAGIPLDTAAAPLDAVAGADALATCGQAGTACAATAAGCCAGNACVNFPELGGSFCTAACVSGDGCKSGCCVPLKSGGSACAPASYCATCKKAGEEGCQFDRKPFMDGCSASPTARGIDGGQVNHPLGSLKPCAYRSHRACPR